MTRDEWLTGDGVRLHAVTAGDPGGPPVVLLHGFPEFSYGWRHQLGPLADAGFRVIAPDQRGYHLSDKPPRVADYAVDRLAADVVAALDGLGVRRAAVVGHDWGGGVAWWLALRHPERVSRLVVMNCPHPLAMRSALAGDPGQLLRSWYVFAFQLPRLPEWALARRDYAGLADAMARTSRRGTFAPADFARYREAWSRPGALTGMVNWYRAAVRHRPEVPAGGRVAVPTLLVWGERDRFLKSTLAAASAAYCADVRVERFPGASHWVQHEEPARVNRLLVEFLRADDGPHPAGRPSASSTATASSAPTTGSRQANPSHT